ncbi:uncharacterized protein LOC34620331 [Cyclospora cayetanensis]|uniref:Uncharacterized protein LOC34620331 n=1 Tax=Cyclospora cayetanensis TaxID=88456 RepID=A0A6P6RQF4_9EIME|nr:uncharacterized protein LOC34620331 [Cyclospora cayetanensis]
MAAGVQSPRHGHAAPLYTGLSDPRFDKVPPNCVPPSFEGEVSNDTRRALCVVAPCCPKIFGRLSGASPVGSALCSPRESTATAAQESLDAEAPKARDGSSKAYSVGAWLETHQPLLRGRRSRKLENARKGEKRTEKQPWEQLFLIEEEKSEAGQPPPAGSLQQQQRRLTFTQFCAATQALPFLWPTTANTGQAPLGIRVVPGVMDWEQFLFFLNASPQNGLLGAVD